MKLISRTFLLGLCFTSLAQAADRWGRPKEAFVNWENAHVHPLEITPDGSTLLAVNTPDNSLLVFDISGGVPVLKSSIPVGLDPVSVRARSSTEAWVVNRVSDDITIVNLPTGTVTSVLATADEPADVAFAGSPQRAFVTCAKQSLLQVWNPGALSAGPQSIFLSGKEPRALAVSADGSQVYAAFFESGNGTTLLTGGKSNFAEVDLVRRPEGPYGGVNVPPNRGTQYVPPLNPANPPPPPVSIIVRKDNAGRWMDDNNGDWSRFVSGDLATLGGFNGGRVVGWDLPDRDVAVIDTASLAVTYQTRLMNSLMAIAVRPGTGEVTVVGTDATNQIRWEPNLQSTFIRVNMARFQAGNPSTITDLNPHLDYTLRTVPPAVRNQSIGDPRGIVWNANGTRAFITGMGSNNVIVSDENGARLARVDVGEGPTGIVMQSATSLVYVLNKFSASISVIDSTSLTETARVPFFDPTPGVIKSGRQFLYNTHLTSGLGQASCASCHIDGRTDRLSWDLGNPAGSMTTMKGQDADNPAGTITVQQPPIKGPLLTMTLQDAMNSPVMHWSGDRPELSAFQAAFVSLQGADAPPSVAGIGQMEDFLDTIHIAPSPNRNRDNSYNTALKIAGPDGATLRTGNASLGAQEFESSCRRCHPGNTMRGEGIRQGGDFGVILNRRPPTWRNFNERDGLWFKSATGSTAGFGFQQDGSFDTTQNQTRSDNLMAFMYSVNGSFPYTPPGLNETNMSRDTHAGVGLQLLFSSNAASAQDATLQTCVQMAERAEIGLIAKAPSGGSQRGFAYVGDGIFQSDRRGELWTVAQVRALAGVLFTVVPAGSEVRIGIDRNLDGVLDGDDASATSAPTFTRSQVNVAPLGTATQSSEYGFNLVAPNAIDGDATTFSHTASADKNASFTLTLNDTYAIDRVTLVNRVGYESRLRDITIYFLDSAGNTITRTHFLNRNNRLNSPAQITLDVPAFNGTPIHAKTLRIVRNPDPFGRGLNAPATSADEANALSLAEVQVYGQLSDADNFFVGSTPRPLPGGTFENVDATGTTITAPARLPWTFQGASGISGSGSPALANNPAPPDGTQALFLPNASAIQQTLRLSAGTYSLSGLAARSGNFTTAQTFAIVVDGQEVGRFTPASTSYSAFQTSSFTVASGPHLISLAGIVANSGSTSTTAALIDSVSIVTAPPAPPTISSVADQSTVAGVAVNLPITATSNSGRGLSYSAQGLPPGLSLDPATGLITGTPTQADRYAVILSATDSAGTATANFVWTITPSAAPVPPVIAPIPNQVLTRGEAANLQAVVSSPSATLYYGATGLPPGIALSNTGLFSQVPTQAGVYNVTLYVSDGALTSSSSFTWTIRDALTLGTVNANGSFVVNLTFGGPVTGLKLSSLIIGNGTASSLTGSGASYKFTVTPNGKGGVSILLPANSATTADGRGTLAVLPLIVPSNSSFEAPAITTTLSWGSFTAAQRTALGWTGSGNGSTGPTLTRNGSTLKYTNAPAGVQAMSLQKTSVISQSVSFPVAGNYVLSWQAAARSTQVNPAEARLDGVRISSWKTSSSQWSAFSTSFYVSSAGAHTIAFAGLSPSDLSVAIDAVGIAATTDIALVTTRAVKSAPATTLATRASWRSLTLALQPAAATQRLARPTKSPRLRSTEHGGAREEADLAWKIMDHDGEFTARIPVLPAGATAGVMLRENLLPGARYAFMGADLGHWVFQSRSTLDAPATLHSVAPGGMPAAAWVRLVREGRSITGFTSANGVDWTAFTTVEISLGESILAGLEVAGESDSPAAFDHVELWQDDSLDPATAFDLEDF